MNIWEDIIYLNCGEDMIDYIYSLSVLKLIMFKCDLNLWFVILM